MTNRWLTRLMGGTASLILSAVMVMALAHSGILNPKGNAVLAASDWVKCCANAKCNPKTQQCCAWNNAAGCRCVGSGTACMQ
jgi:hypothetical protein